jgi:tetratricopeptide (TPR) repeat protein
VQLTDAGTDENLWGQSYERDLRDVLSLQDEVAQTIARQIQAKLTTQEQSRMATIHTVNPGAHEVYLRGRYAWNKRTESELRKAILYFQHAIQDDPNYAVAYSGLADSYALLGGIYSAEPPGQTFPNAKAAALKALELNDDLAEAHTSLAMIMFWYDWDLLGAEKEFKRAIQLNPGYASAHQWYGWDLAALGRIDEAIVETNRALEADPLSLPVNTSAIFIFYLGRKSDLALEQCRKTLELDPNFARAHADCGQAYDGEARYEQASAEFLKAAGLSGRSSVYLGLLGHALARAGNRREAERVLDELQQRSKQRFVSPYDIAMIYLGLGEKREAFAWLQKSREERSVWLPFLKMDPLYDPLRSDPHFQELVHRVGLPP